MAKFLFSLRNVPDDEADDIRQLLAENGIEFYETSAGLLGISTPAIWLEQAEQYAIAKRLVDEYQKERGAAQRQAYERLKAEGKAKTLKDSFDEDPLRFILYIGIVLVILYFSTKPFLDLAQ